MKWNRVLAWLASAGGLALAVAAIIPPHMHYG